MSNFASYSNMQDIMTAIGQKFAEVNGAYVFKGSKTFAQLPSTLTAAMTGYTYNMSEEFTTDSRFVEGAGKKYPAGTNVTVANLGDDTTPDMKFDVVSSFVDVDAIMAAIDAVSDMIAGEFDATESYAAGDVVVYDGALYKFNTAHAAGAWVGTDATETTVVELISDQKTISAILAADMADPFSSIASYTAGDVVSYNYRVYRFTADKTAGAWDSTKVEEIELADLINEVAADVDKIYGDLADDFNATTAYSAGDVVLYNGQLYKFNAAHAAGGWIGTDADAVTVADIVESAEPEELTTAQVQALIALL